MTGALIVVDPGEVPVGLRPACEGKGSEFRSGQEGDYDAPWVSL
jgi:hypothetical protein